MRSVVALLQFTTVLPLGKPADFEAFAKRSCLYPLAGYVIGGIAAIAVYWIANPLVAAAVATTIVLLLSGCNHFDGLLDLGDGLMAHGDREKRVRALTDRQVGAGGVALGITVTLLLFAGLAASASAAVAILAGEVCAKFSMAFLTATGRPFNEGIHSYLYGHARPYFPFISFLLCLPLVLLPVSPLRLAAAAAVMVACPVVLLLASKRLFGGINGDVVGAGNEITRALVILALVIT
ncbi:MAG: cobalamin synthase [Methanoregula sp. PtaU1.Bin051]|nr:MAG: cobalamin synthase [Methanoregula sp. PtaU1.Bin051]